MQVEIYKNVGKFDNNGQHTFTFSNGYIEVYIMPECCDIWMEIPDDFPFENFKGRDYKLTSRENMHAKEILYVVIKNYDNVYAETDHEEYVFGIAIMKIQLIIVNYIA